MMKQRTKIWTWGWMVSLTMLTGFAALLVSCAADSEETSGAGTMSVPLRITTSGSSTTFDENDQVSIYAWVNNGNGMTGGAQYDAWLTEVKMKYQGGEWKNISSHPLYWKDQTTEHIFLAVSPIRGVSDALNDEFTVTDDVAASDLRAARYQGRCTTSAVDLELEHLMARLDVNITIGSEVTLASAADVTSVTVTTTAYQKAAINYLGDNGIEVSTTGNAATMTLKKVSNNDGTWQFSNVMVPQNLKKMDIIVTFSDGSVRTYPYVPSAAITLQRNHLSTYNLMVEKNQVIEEEGSCSVSEWGLDNEMPMLTPDYAYDSSTKTVKAYTANGLLAWAEKVNSDAMTNLTLMNDITMPDDTPMPTIDVISCVIDGQGHTISNLRFTTNSYRSFCRYNQGTIKNLIFDFAEENDHPSNYACFYGIADINYGTIENCKVKGFANKFRYSNAICRMNVSGGSVIGCESHLSIQTPGINGSNYDGMVEFNKGEIIACLDASIPSTTNASAVCFQNGDIEYSSDISISGYIWYCMDKVDFSNSNKQSIINNSGDVAVTTYDADDAQNQVNALNSNLEYLYINNSWSYTRYRFKYNSSNTENPVSVAPYTN